jgi:hypothetical protein
LHVHPSSRLQEHQWEAVPAAERLRHISPRTM